MNNSKEKDCISTSVCEVAAAVIYLVLQTRSDHTGINKVNQNDALYNVLNHQWVASADINRDYRNMIKEIDCVEKELSLESIVYDDFYPRLEKGKLILASQNYDEAELNRALSLIKEPSFKIKCKRKSRNLRAIFSQDEDNKEL